MSCDVFRVGKIWHYRFQIGLQRIQRSTREQHKGRADAVAKKAYAEAIIVANGGQPVPILAALIREWQAIHAPIISRAHARSVDTFSRLHLYDLGNLPISEISTERVELARNEHLLTHKPASANHWLRILKLIANWAVKRGIIHRLPWKVKMLKVQKRPRTTLPADIAREWFSSVDAACAKSISIATAIRMMFGLGLREGEAASARWEWMDWQRQTYTPGQTKGREAEPVPVPQWLIAYLAPLRKDEGLIAPKSDGTQHPSGFSRKVMRTANAACKLKGITPHRLRGTFATMLSEAGVPIQDIQKVLRHKSPLTTMSYLEKNLERAALAQQKIGEKTRM